MFQKICLQNYRTHKDTEIEIHPITLLIGNNNSGKSNFLAGIRHFSQLIGKAQPGDIRNQLSPSDFFPHRYRLASEE